MSKSKEQEFVKRIAQLAKANKELDLKIKELQLLNAPSVLQT